MRQFTVDPEMVKEHVAILKKAYDAVSRFKQWNKNGDPLVEHCAYCVSGQMWEDIEDGEGALTVEQFEMASEYHEKWTYDPSYDYDYFQDDGKDYA